MNTTASHVVLLAAVSAIGMFTADNSLGTWKRNVAKTTYQQGSPPANPIVEQTVIREAALGGVKITIKGKRKDGTSLDSTHIVKYDGKPTAIPRGLDHRETLLFRLLKWMTTPSLRNPGRSVGSIT